MQKIKPVLLYTSLFFALASLSTAPKGEHVKWLNIADAQINLTKEKRPVLVDLYTDWCGWCKVMDKKTYSNKNVADYLADKFYAVKVNAETREKIQWDGKTYNFNSAYRANDFAIYITKGQLQFPTSIIIPADGSEPQAIPGYLETKDFEVILKYFGEGNYKTTSFDVYQKSFKPSW